MYTFTYNSYNKSMILLESKFPIRNFSDAINLYEDKDIDISDTLLHYLLNNKNECKGNVIEKLSHIKVKDPGYSDLYIDKLINFFDYNQLKNFIEINNGLKKFYYIKFNDFDNVDFDNSKLMLFCNKHVIKKCDQFVFLITKYCNENRISLPLDISEEYITDLGGNFVNYLYKNKCDYIINYYNIEILINDSPNLKKEIGQNYLGTHEFDNEIIVLMNDSKKSFTKILYSIRNNIIYDVEYILNHIKFFNIKNLKIFKRLVNYSYYRKTEHNDKNDKLFKLLNFKFSKYVLSSNYECNYITEYFK